MRDIGGALGDGHIEDKILQRGGLRGLPMQACWHQRLATVVGGRGHVGEIEDKVANVTEELVLICVPRAVSVRLMTLDRSGCLPFVSISRW